MANIDFGKHCLDSIVVGIVGVSETSQAKSNAMRIVIELYIK